MRTATGNHVLLWQADESDYDLPSAGPHAHELRFIKDTYALIASQKASGLEAKVRINDDGDNRRNLHYVLAPEGSEAAATWAATPLSYSTAPGLVSGVDNGTTVYWHHTKRITYELQDLADIFQTNWQHAPWYIHWLSSDSVDVALESPLVNEAGQLEVSAGLQRFHTQSRDIGKASLTDGRESILSKNWFHGAYSAEFNADTPSNTDIFPGFEGLGSTVSD